MECTPCAIGKAHENRDVAIIKDFFLLPILEGRCLTASRNLEDALSWVTCDTDNEMQRFRVTEDDEVDVCNAKHVETLSRKSTTQTR